MRYEDIDIQGEDGGPLRLDLHGSEGFRYAGSIARYGARTEDRDEDRLPVDKALGVIHLDAHFDFFRDGVERGCDASDNPRSLFNGNGLADTDFPSIIFRNVGDHFERAVVRYREDGGGHLYVIPAFKRKRI